VVYATSLVLHPLSFEIAMDQTSCKSSSPSVRDVAKNEACDFDSLFFRRLLLVKMKLSSLLATAALSALLLAQTSSAKQTLKVGLLVPGSGEDCAVGLQHWYIAQYATEYIQNASWWPSNNLSVRARAFPRIPTRRLSSCRLLLPREDRALPFAAGNSLVRCINTIFCLAKC